MTLLVVFQLGCGFSNRCVQQELLDFVIESFQLTTGILDGFSDSVTTLVVLRFAAGCLASAGPGGVGVATVADLFEPQERGRRESVSSKI